MPWFFDPHFGGQNCLSVAQALQAEFGNLMAVRQNLCVQIGVCWLQRLIELAGKELVIFKFDFLMACAEVGGCFYWFPLRKPNACGVAVWMCTDRGFKKLLRLRFAQFREEVHLVIFLCSLPGCYLKWTLSFMIWYFFIIITAMTTITIIMIHFYAPFTFTAWSTMIFPWKGLWWSIVCSVKNCCSECGLHVVCVRRAAICAAVGCALELEVPEMLLDAWA